MFRTRRSRRHVAAFVLVAWVLALATGIVHACLVQPALREAGQATPVALAGLTARATPDAVQAVAHAATAHDADDHDPAAPAAIHGAAATAAPPAGLHDAPAAPAPSTGHADCEGSDATPAPPAAKAPCERFCDEPSTRAQAPKPPDAAGLDLVAVLPATSRIAPLPMPPSVVLAAADPGRGRAAAPLSIVYLRLAL